GVAQDIARLTVAGECASVPLLPAAIPVVEVTIGGKGPYRFAIDTGAQGHGRISMALAEQLGLPKVGEVGAPAPGGAVATRPVFGAAEVSVGDISFKNIDLVAMSDVRGPQSEWDGILGNELLELVPLTLDYGNARARFGGPGLSEGVPVKFDRGIPIVPVEIAGQRFEVHFDSGNGAGGLFLDEDKAKGLPLGGEPVQRGAARTTFGDSPIMEAPLAVPGLAGGTAPAAHRVGLAGPRPGRNPGSEAMGRPRLPHRTEADPGGGQGPGGAPRCR